MQHIKQAVLTKLQGYKNIAIQKGYEPPVYGVRFDLKGTCAGKACWRGEEFWMQFNLDIAAENLDEYLNRTVPHELAHILQYKYARGSKPHGPEWDRFCVILTGKTMPRCHSYDVNHLRRKRNVKYYLYSCGCRTHQISSTTHNRIMSGKKRYNCTRCDCVIRPNTFAF